MQSFASAAGAMVQESRLAQFVAMKNALEAEPMVRELRAKYPNHEFHLLELMQYVEDQRRCLACTGLSNCKNMDPGRYLGVVPDEPKYAFRPYKCQKQVDHERQQEIRSKIKSHNIDEAVLAMTFRSLERDEPGCLKALTEAMRYCVNFKRGETAEGLYLHGKFGVGKSAVVGAIANEMGERGIDVLAVYWPDFLEELKGSFKTGGVDEKIDALKQVSVLIIDDIGAESNSAWTRDSVLGPILNHRMAHKLPTIFTSNLSLSELEFHLSTTKDAGIEKVKAARLMERIEPFVAVYEMTGRNRRREKVKRHVG